MQVLPKLRALIRNLLHKRHLERELDAELSSYVELLTERNEQAGMQAEEAKRAALLQLEGREQVKERVRESRSSYRLELLFQDLRYACRSLCKAPAFSLTVVVVLALGIGSTTLMFAIVHSVLLKGPPFPAPDRLFTLWQRIPQEARTSFSPNEFSALKKQTQIFESLAFVTGTGFTISGRGGPELVIGRLVLPSFFDVLRTSPQLGRDFTQREMHEHLVVLSDELWRDNFGGRPDVLGQVLTMNGQPYTVIGVLPKSFYVEGGEAKLFVPADLSDPLFAQHPDAHFLRVIARLRGGVTQQQLDAELARIGPQLDPGDKTDRHYFALSLKEATTGELRTPLLVLLSAVAFLLLIACANVANLTLARSNARQKEIALRAALGASRGRLVSQLLTESMLLATIGGAIGIGMAAWGLDLVRALVGHNVPQLLSAQINRTVLAFTLIGSGLAVTLFGLGPALTTSRFDFQNVLKGLSRSSTAERTRQGLVLGEIAVAAVLLICCMLMLRSFAALTHVDPGFTPSGAINASVFLSKESYPEMPQMVQFYRRALEAVRALPGVAAAGVVTHLPFGGNSWGNGFDVEGYTPPPGDNGSAQIRPVSPGYFAALGIPLKQGRDFNEDDRENAPGVAVVNELFAKRFWPNESPLGKRVRYYKDWLSVIGVCGNIKHSRLDADSDMEIYVSYPQVDAEIMKFVGRDLNFVVRSNNVGSVSLELRNTLRALDPNAVVKITTMEALIHESTAEPRFRTWLIAIFAGFALLLACLGVYGVIGYLVAQRYREMGIRIALGATVRDILQLILGRTLKLAGLGVVAGLVAAFVLSRLLASILFGVTVHDPITFVGVPLGLTLLALLAAYLPARRASQVDPIASLRYE